MDLPRQTCDTDGFRAGVLSVVALRPERADQIPKLVKVAAQQRIGLNPISTGRNWGYGAVSPVKPGCAVLDLSDLCAIRVVDAEFGLVELEPGVTQGMLAEYLQAHNIDRMVPVRGGGPDCSLVGNALERGYGLTPTTDHFLGLTALQGGTVKSWGGKRSCSVGMKKFDR